MTRPNNEGTLEMKYVKSIAILLGVSLFWIALSVYGALYGWWLSPIAPNNDTQTFISAE